jgi:hypothetical protein
MLVPHSPPGASGSHTCLHWSMKTSSSARFACRSPRGVLQNSCKARQAGLDSSQGRRTHRVPGSIAQSSKPPITLTVKIKFSKLCFQRRLAETPSNEAGRTTECAWPIESLDSTTVLGATGGPRSMSLDLMEHRSCESREDVWERCSGVYQVDLVPSGSVRAAAESLRQDGSDRVSVPDAPRGGPGDKGPCRVISRRCLLERL